MFRENLDNIVGSVFMKDLLHTMDGGIPTDAPIQRLLRPATFVPETKRVPELLKEFQRKQVQIAIVVDEYGGTAGLVTIEDLLEEIVGEIRDEYDVESEPIVDHGDGTFVFSAKVSIDEFRDRLGVDIEDEGFETVGGYVLSRRRSRPRRRRDVRDRRPDRRGPRSGAPPDPQGARAKGIAGAVGRPERRALMPRRAGYASFIGRPNAGKSTLLNTIVGAKVAIVSDKPQTTRSRILAAKNYPEGQIVFVDTPGIHRPLHRLNVRMVDAAVETLREVDVVALVVDASSKMGRGDEYVSGLSEGRPGARHPRAQQDRSGRQGEAAAAHRADRDAGTTSSPSFRSRPRPATASIAWSACSSSSFRKVRRSTPRIS